MPLAGWLCHSRYSFDNATIQFSTCVRLPRIHPATKTGGHLHQPHKKQAWILILSPFTSSLFFPSSLSPSLIVWDGTGQRSQSITLGYMIPINQWEPLVLYYLVMISGGGEVLKSPKSWVPAIQSYKHLTGKEDGVRIPIRSPSQSVLSHSTRRRERNQGSLQPLMSISPRPSSTHFFHPADKDCQLQPMQVSSDAHQKLLLKPSLRLISTRWPEISVSAKFC